MQRAIVSVLGVSAMVLSTGTLMVHGQSGVPTPAQGQRGDAQGQRGAGQGRGGGRGGVDWHQPPSLPLEPGAAQADVTRAVTAAPANLAAEATVIKWKADFTYDTLRRGMNQLVCYDLSGKPAQPVFSTECTTVNNLPRVAQNLKFAAMGDQRQAMLDAAEKDGTRIKPEPGSIWYHMLGPNRWGAHSHVTIAVPGATAQALGVPGSGSGGGVWIMNPGTTTAHLMLPEGPASTGQGGAPGPGALPLEPGAVQAEVNRITLALPANLSGEATVIQWKTDFTYTTLRKGKNRLVCYDLADRPTHPAFASECTSLANLPRVAQNLKFEAMGERGPAMMEAAERDGTREKPEYGSVWYDLTGPHRWDARLHVTIALPGATARQLGLPDNANRGGAWIMNAGTTAAHLMRPDDPSAVVVTMFSAR